MHTHYYYTITNQIKTKLMDTHKSSISEYVIDLANVRKKKEKDNGHEWCVRKCLRFWTIKEALLLTGIRVNVKKYNNWNGLLNKYPVVLAHSSEIRGLRST